MHRRTILVGTVAFLAAPFAAEAQPAGKMYRIGYLGLTSPSAYARLVEAFRQALGAPPRKRGLRPRN